MTTLQGPRQQAVAEIEALANELGVALPMAVEQILRLEACGATVDLVTGEIHWNGANVRFRVTEAGEAALRQAQGAGSELEEVLV